MANTKLNVYKIVLQEVCEKSEVGLSRLRRFLSNELFFQSCSKIYHHLFVWCLKLKTNEF